MEDGIKSNNDMISKLNSNSDAVYEAIMNVRQQITVVSIWCNNYEWQLKYLNS